jgi:hypothetical protein
LNFNKGDSHVDMHVAEHKQPTRLLTMMMDAPPVVVDTMGLRLGVPRPELLLLHAAMHGCLASGPTDLIQAVVDVTVLGPRTNPRTLLACARRTRTLLPLVEIEEAIDGVGARPLQLDVSWTDLARARAEEAADTVIEVASESSSVLQRVRTRKRSDRALADVSEGFNGRRGAYGLWLRMGQFAVFERAVARTTGGFLEPPIGTVTSGKTVQPFLDDDIPGMTASRVSTTAMDWRFRVDFPAPQDRVRLVLDSASLDTLDAFVFCNGVPITRVVAGDPGTRDIVLRGLGRQNEFSVRALWTVCSECYRGLDDLSVRIDLGDAV